MCVSTMYSGGQNDKNTSLPPDKNGFNCIVGLLKHLGNIATVLLYLVCLGWFSFFMSFQTDRIIMMMRSDICVEHWLLSDSNLTGLINAKITVWKLIFPTDNAAQDS